MRFYLASRNKGKMRELTEILAPLGIELKPLPEDFPEIEENGTTFEENAKIKARTVSAVLGAPAIADDSGLEVAALGGEPGVYSVRWAGENKTDHERNVLLLERMRSVPENERGAKFVCVAACAFPDGKTLAVRGECRGTILDEERGTGGFGYDPIFCVPEYSCTFGELEPEVKNSISHRARAFAALGSTLRVYLEIIGEE